MVVGVGGPSTSDRQEPLGVDGFGGVDQGIDVVGEELLAVSCDTPELLDVCRADRPSSERRPDAVVAAHESRGANQTRSLSSQQRSAMGKPRDGARAAVGFPGTRLETRPDRAEEFGVDPLAFGEQVEHTRRGPE